MELVRTVRESEHSRNLRDKLLARHDQLPPLLFQVHFSSPASSRDRAAAAWVVVLGSAVKDARKVPAQRKIQPRSPPDLHPLVGALARVDPLAGAPGLNACLLEGEHASSPVGRHWSGLGALGVSRAFLSLLPQRELYSSAKPFAPKNKAVSADDWRLVWEELDSRSSLGGVLELLDMVWDAPGSPFWDREILSAIQGLSGNLAHELLPLLAPL